ncbi:O-antigen ligase family protein [Ureibacillus suwonensis]|uniref:O-antigen ligase family protein n=1 Tax=Ureibacillus suwonensis TaxID=313007 RepID=A0ABW0REX8_9BACL
MIVKEANIITDINKNKDQISILTITLFLLAIFLNQTFIFYGINTSLADIFCILTLSLIVNKLVIPIKHLAFFIVLSISVFISSTFFVPITLGYHPEIKSVFSNYIKLAMVFLYFIIGYNIAKLKAIDKVIKWYSIVAFFCAIIGIVWSFLKINFLSEILFFGGTRFRGFLNDPNYFSIIQITALAYLSRTVKTKCKFIIWIVFILSVVTTGSKTGMVTLVIYASIRFIEYLISIKNNLQKNLLKVPILILLLLIIIPILTFSYQTIFQKLSVTFPVFLRIESVFFDFSSSITENGSGRLVTWENAIKLILLSPILGIGVGTYSGLANTLFGSVSIAHNTYLQLAVEWGLPLALVFFIYVISILWISYRKQKIKNTVNTISILRDIIIILLIGSMAISLNNARMFWLYFGSLVYSVFFHKREK